MEMRKNLRVECGEAGERLDCFLIEPGIAHGSVLICPGGGYEYCSTREADPVAHAYNRAGFHAFILWYNCENPPLEWKPLQQLADAMVQIRKHAEDWQLDPDKIAVCGFSAGAHLAGMLGALWHNPARVAQGADAKPNALILSYPVVTAGEGAHRDSFVQLAGQSREAQQAFSLESMVTPDMPPVFLWHTMDDDTVPVRNTIMLSQALLKAHVPQEVHLFPHGAHGLSLATADTSDIQNGRIPDEHVAQWFHLSTQWLIHVFGNPEK